jgi:hypothetical protein
LDPPQPPLHPSLPASKPSTTRIESSLVAIKYSSAALETTASARFALKSYLVTWIYLHFFIMAAWAML